MRHLLRDVQHGADAALWLPALLLRSVLDWCAGPPALPDEDFNHISHVDGFCMLTVARLLVPTHRLLPQCCAGGAWSPLAALPNAQVRHPS